MSINAAIVGELAAIVGPQGLRDGAALAGLDPGTRADNFEAGLALLPKSTEEASAVLALCRCAGLSVVPQGGRSGLVGGCVSRVGEVIVMTDRLNRIEDLDAEAGTAVVQAGVTLERLNLDAAGQGLCLGVDLGGRGTATVGGMISTNAGGNQAFRFGVMRQQVLVARHRDYDSFMEANRPSGQARCAARCGTSGK